MLQPQLQIRNWIGILILSFSLSTLADQKVAVIFGSFSSLGSARAECLRLQPLIDQPLSLQEVSVKGRTYFRILGSLKEDLPGQRAYLKRVQSSLQPAAWLYFSSNLEIVELPCDSKEPTSGIDITPERVTPERTPNTIPEVPLTGVIITQKNDNRGITTGDSSTGSENVKLPALEAADLDNNEILILAQFQEKDLNLKIDGRLDEVVWSRVRGVDNMKVIEPDSLEDTAYSTDAKLFYTEKGLYVGIWNQQPPDTLLARLTKRDMYINRDGNTVMIDTSGESLYGLWFDVNLGGSVADGKLRPEKIFSKDWDGPWKSGSQETGDGYTTEYFLPWSMMAMPDVKHERKMSVLLMRRVANRDETWAWPGVPFTASKFMSAMQPVQLRGVNLRRQFAFYPFSSATYDDIDSDTDFRTGIDMFWRPSSNLQLTTTLNPDFGTVETDDVVINLSAFETFFSEKRLFFLEGNEIFVTTPRSNPFGSSSSYSIGARKTRSSFVPIPTTLVNTRRIGGAALSPVISDDESIPDVELFQPSQLYGAFKVTGQNGPVRYGVMAAFEEDIKFHGQNTAGEALRIDQIGRDFGIFRVSLEDTSNGLKSLGWITTAVLHPDRDALVHGVDGHYISPTTRWRTDLQLMYSDVENVDGFGGFADVTYKPRQGISHKLTFDYLDEDLEINDLGFVRRNDVIGMSYSYEHLTSKLENFRSWTNSWLFSQQYNQDGRLVRSGVFWRNNFILQNSWLARTELNYFPRRWDDRNSEGNGDFRIEDRWVAEIGIGTLTSSMLSVSLAIGVMQEELGGWTNLVKGGFTYKPSDNLSLELDLLYQRRDGWLLHQEGRNFTTYKSTNWYPKLSLEYLLSARQQLLLTMQWAGIIADEQASWEVPLGDGDLVRVNKEADDRTTDFGISQISVQLRYRWEIAPLSDLSVVYTRGSKLVTAGEDDFEDLFGDALNEPQIDLFVVKLRYRFGT